jgi:hypothetical protein
MTESDLVYWATMILLNDAYEIDPEDEDFIADWLNDISYNLDLTNPSIRIATEDRHTELKKHKELG